MGTRPKIPPEVKRLLRQESGFGCCVCGRPILQFHHIVPWSEDEHYRPEDMMVLCPLCHDQATKGALPESEQRAAKARPLNVERGWVGGPLKVSQRYCAVAAGGVLMVSEGPVISVDGEPLLSLGLGDGGELLLSVALYSKSNDLLAMLVDNEWISGDPLPWDLESDWRRLTLRERSKRVSLRIDARAEPLMLRADLWRNGQLVRLSPAGIRLDGVAVTGSGIADLGLANFGLNVDTVDKTCRIEALDGRFGAFISEADPSLRLCKSINAYRNLVYGGANGSALERPAEDE